MVPTNPNDSSSNAADEPKREGMNWQELLAWICVILMYGVWIGVHALVNSPDAQQHIVIFFLVVTRYFMSDVPELREKPRTLKNVVFGWFLFPIVYSAIMAGMMVLVEHGIELLSEKVFD